jgi:energy-coupling factor transporter ATP-binding protein EcfA2
VRIKRIEIENFLSFRMLVLDDVDDTLSVIVGPNGAGKSNLIKALRMVCESFDAQARGNWGGAAHDADPDAGFHIGIEIELTDGWERDLLLIFLQAVLVSQDVSETLREDYVRWIQTLTSAGIANLHKGTIEIECQAGEWWTVS